jgi:hypothetical protein
MNSRQRSAQGRIEFAKKLGLTPVEEGIPSPARIARLMRENPIVAHMPESPFVTSPTKPTSRPKKGKK